MGQDCEFPYAMASFLPFWKLMLPEGCGSSSKCLATQQLICSYLLPSRLAQGETTLSNASKQNQRGKKSDQISFPSCVSVEVGVIAKLEMQMFCFNLVNNPQMNCMLKHVDLFLTLKWDLVISLFSGMYGYLFPLLHKITFIMSLYLISKYSIFLFQSLIFFLVNIFSEQLQCT